MSKTSNDLLNRREKLDVEQDKVEDCHREIEIYRQQLEGASQSLDQLKAEMNELRESHSQGACARIQIWRAFLQCV